MRFTKSVTVGSLLAVVTGSLWFMADRQDVAAGVPDGAAFVVSYSPPSADAAAAVADGRVSQAEVEAMAQRLTDCARQHGFEFSFDEKQARGVSRLLIHRPSLESVRAGGPEDIGLETCLMTEWLPVKEVWEQQV